VRRYQRGFLVEALIYAALAAAALFAIHKAWDTFVAEPYRIEGAQIQLAADLPKLNAANQRATVAEAQAGANKTRAETAEGTAAQQTAALATAHMDAVAAQASARAANIKYADEVAKNAKRDAERKADAEGPAPTVAVSCEQELKDTADILRTSAIVQQAPEEP